MSLLTWSYLMPINFKEVSFRDRLGIGVNLMDPNEFMPEGFDYDYKRAKQVGMTRQLDPETKEMHLGSVAPTTKAEREKYGLPEESYVILKGRQHESWDKAVKGEAERGFRIKQYGDRYYSVPAEINTEGKEVDIDFKTQTQNLLKAKGYTPTAIAGIMGNIDVETGGTFNFQEKQRGGKGYGVFQFDFLNPYYQKYLEKSEKKDSLESQIDFMHETVYGDEQDIIGRGNAKKLRKGLEEAKTPEEAAETFMNIFEKPGVPHLDRRIESSKKFGGDLGIIKADPITVTEEDVSD